MSLFDQLVNEALRSRAELTSLRPVVEKELLHHDILREMSEAGGGFEERADHGLRAQGGCGFGQRANAGEAAEGGGLEHDGAEVPLPRPLGQDGLQGFVERERRAGVAGELGKLCWILQRLLDVLHREIGDGTGEDGGVVKVPCLVGVEAQPGAAQP